MYFNVNSGLFQVHVGLYKQLEQAVQYWNSTLRQMNQVQGVI